MATTIKVESFGFAGEGPTVKAAKEDAARKVHAAMRMTYQPTLLHYRGTTIVVYADPHLGYNYTIAHADRKDGIAKSGCVISGANGTDREAREETIRAASRHLAQIGFEVGETEAPDWVTNKADRAELRTWYEFQNRYADARKRGMTDEQAHDYASRNPWRNAELWQNETTNAA